MSLPRCYYPLPKPNTHLGQHNYALLLQALNDEVTNGGFATGCVWKGATWEGGWGVAG